MKENSLSSVAGITSRGTLLDLLATHDASLLHCHHVESKINFKKMFPAMHALLCFLGINHQKSLPSSFFRKLYQSLAPCVFIGCQVLFVFYGFKGESGWFLLVLAFLATLIYLFCLSMMNRFLNGDHFSFLENKAGLFRDDEDALKCIRSTNTIVFMVYFIVGMAQGVFWIVDSHDRSLFAAFLAVGYVYFITTIALSLTVVSCSFSLTCLVMNYLGRQIIVSHMELYPEDSIGILKKSLRPDSTSNELMESHSKETIRAAMGDESSLFSDANFVAGEACHICSYV
jgi:hypothetical protein